MKPKKQSKTPNFPFLNFYGSRFIKERCAKNIEKYIIEGNYKAFHEIVSRSMVYIKNWKSSDGLPAAFLAARYGRLNILQYLVDTIRIDVRHGHLDPKSLDFIKVSHEAVRKLDDNDDNGELLKNKLKVVKYLISLAVKNTRK